MVVQHNLTAMNANRMLGMTSKAYAKSIEHLSSGYRINCAADDAAGLSISEKMRRQIRGLTQASSNAQDGISMVQVADGACAEVSDMLQRMNELAVKASNGTLSSDDRQYIQNEINQLVSEIDRIGSTTKFNELYALKGDENEHCSIHVGQDATAENAIDIELADISAKALGFYQPGKYTGDWNYEMDVSTQGRATRMISVISNAISYVSGERSRMGAYQNRLEHTVNNLDNVIENTTAAESRIRDTDMAKEMVEMARLQILMQAGQAMLAQSNQSKQGVLNLLL